MQEYISLSRKLSSVKQAASQLPASASTLSLQAANYSVQNQMDEYEYILKKFMREMNSNQPN